MTRTPMSAAAKLLPRQPQLDEHVQRLARFADGLDVASLWWLSGYAAGLARRVLPMPVADVSAATAGATVAGLTIVYGSQTGNAKRVAEQLAGHAEATGLAVRLLRADTYPVRELAQERLLVVVISTQGDGEPPDDARDLVDYLASRRAPRLASLAFAVLGLGDSSYPQFCVTGRKLDERLAELGAQRAHAFTEADVDVDVVAAPWAAAVLARARDLLQAHVPATKVTPLRPQVDAQAWSATRPFRARVLANQRLTAPDSDKDVRHIELSLEGAGIDYEPGDALAVVPRNPPALVDAVLAATRLDGGATVTLAGIALPLREWLAGKRELTRLGRPFVAALVERSGDSGLAALLQPGQGEALRALLEAQQPLDLLQRYTVAWAAADLVAALRPLTPRLYSIASSRAEVGDEVHLTVAHVEYARDGETRWGAASHWLATRGEGDSVDVYLERNERFRLPAESARDVVMIGPGTGVAPFRAFVQQRAEAGASGRNWLIFGNPHFRSDFLYQLEWQAALKSGALARLDLAFSRDQGDKIYVQQRVRERGAELFAWLEAGAYLYVCGATAMARDVEVALREVVAVHGRRSGEDADAYLADLRERRRYARDVY